MTELLATALALAVAGVDPAGAAIAVAALARGVSRRAVLAFTAVVVLGTAAFGTALSLLAGQALADVNWSTLLDGDVAAVVELAIAALLLGWGVFRLRRPAARPPKPHGSKGAAGAGLLGLGVVFAASAVVDPTFVGLAVVAGRDEPVAGVVLAQLIWITVSQLPLVALTVAVAAGAHERLLGFFTHHWRKVAPVARVALTVILFLAAGLLAADGLKQLISGAFLIG